MFKDQIDIQLKYEKFIKKTCETGIVYGLESDEGFATSSSNEFEDEEGNAVPLLCFWSEKALAQSCIKEDWEKYRVVEIALPDFFENWCVGMHNDALLAGINFDQNMFGYEAEPIELLLELITESRQNKRHIPLLKYKDLDDLERNSKEIVG